MFVLIHVYFLLIKICSCVDTKLFVRKATLLGGCLCHPPAVRLMRALASLGIQRE